MLITFYKPVFYVVLFFALFACGSQPNSVEEGKGSGVEIKVFTYEDLEKEYLSTKADKKLYIMNFWATWCIPCVEELPVFERINKEKDVDVILVSLDFRSKIKTDLLPFLKNNQIESEVVVLHEPDANKWINLIDPDWSGALPATLVFNSKGTEFYEGQLDYNILKQIILKLK